MKLVIKALIKEAINNEKSGKKAFQAFTPGRQRAYLLHFTGAKQSSTRMSRIEKCRPQIMQGKGMNE